MNKINIEKTFGEAFETWRSVMRYNVLFSVLYLGLSMVFTFGLLKHTGLLEKMMELQEILAKNPEIYLKRMTVLAQSREFLYFSMMQIFAMGLLFPLNIGLLEIIKKKKEQKEITIKDLFVGYNGVDFIKYAGYFIFWQMFYNAINGAGILAFLLKPLWVGLMLLVAPLMYFRNEMLGSAILLSFQALRKHFFVIMLGVIAAFLFSYSGAILLGFGLIFTMPFWAAMIFSLYQQIFDNEELKNNN